MALGTLNQKNPKEENTILRRRKVERKERKKLRRLNQKPSKDEINAASKGSALLDTTALDEELKARPTNSRGGRICQAERSDGPICQQTVRKGANRCGKHGGSPLQRRSTGLQSIAVRRSFKKSLQESRAFLDQQKFQNVDMELAFTRTLLEELITNIEQAPTASRTDPSTGKKVIERIIPLDLLESARRLASTSSDITIKRQQLMEGSALARIEQVLQCLSRTIEVLPSEERQTFLARFQTELDGVGLSPDGDVQTIARAAIHHR